jgi:hypothetical protein
MSDAEFNRVRLDTGQLDELKEDLKGTLRETTAPHELPKSSMWKRAGQALLVVLGIGSGVWAATSNLFTTDAEAMVAHEAMGKEVADKFTELKDKDLKEIKIQHDEDMKEVTTIARDGATTIEILLDREVIRRKRLDKFESRLDRVERNSHEH